MRSHSISDLSLRTVQITTLMTQRRNQVLGIRTDNLATIAAIRVETKEVFLPSAMTKVTWNRA